MKSELKRERYGSLKIWGPRCEDWKLPGTFSAKTQGIYIIMYTNSRTFAQKLQSGPDLGYLIDLGYIIDLGGFSARFARHR
jgi:hypothetical protein